MKFSALKGSKLEKPSPTIKNSKRIEHQCKPKNPQNQQNVQDPILQIKMQDKIDHKKPNIFEGYLEILKRKILKRKIILFILNIILTLVAFLFCVFFLIWGNVLDSTEVQTEIQKIFSIQFSWITLGFIGIIGVLGIIFAIIIIKGKVILLHCYWISCLLFLIILSVISASAFSLMNMDCEQPSSYILQQLKSTNYQANQLFCSDICPCTKNSTISNNNSTAYGRIQDCPSWKEVVYSSFFSSVESTLKCSGWCSINPKSYYTFYKGGQDPPAADQINCFSSIQNKIESQTLYFRVLTMILCLTLVLVIFYTNYYIFMEKEDENRETKKIKTKIIQTQQIMEDQLRTSKRMLP